MTEQQILDDYPELDSDDFRAVYCHRRDKTTALLPAMTSRKRVPSAGTRYRLYISF
jgi:hypothetical protein